MADTHEVYPNAPLALVTVEVRFPDAGSGTTTPVPMTLQRAFRDLLGADWVIESLKAQKLSLSVGAGGVATQLPSQLVTIPRFTVRDRTLAVAITDESLTIETTRYTNYPAFRTVLAKALEAARNILSPDGIARVGMRYIDEIRVPDVAEKNPWEWERWVDPTLLPPHSDALTDGIRVTAWEGAVQYETGASTKLVLRYGPKSGYAVNPVGPLKRPGAPPPGPLFVLDFDSFWEPEDIPEFDDGVLLAKCDELRVPIRALFDGLLTSQLIAEFKKEANRG